MARRYSGNIYTFSQGDRKGQTARIIVADWEQKNKFEWDENDPRYRPPLCIFTVSVLHDEESQRNVANKLVDYLNAVLDAQDKAVVDDALLQKIML